MKNVKKPCFYVCLGLCFGVHLSLISYYSDCKGTRRASFVSIFCMAKYVRTPDITCLTNILERMCVFCVLRLPSFEEGVPGSTLPFQCQHLKEKTSQLNLVPPPPPLVASASDYVQSSDEHSAFDVSVFVTPQSK